MNTINLSIDLPNEIGFYDLNALKKELTEIASVLLRHQFIKVRTEEADPFAELDTSWGGDRDANEIADELHDSRVNNREIETW